MNITRERDVQLAATQAPLLRLEQATPGAIVTGIAMQFAWEIYRINGEFVELVHVPRTDVICADASHTFTAYGRGQVCGRCRLRKQKLEEFLPRTPEKPRAYIITPSAPLVMPQPFTLYGYMKGDTMQTVSIDEAGNWSEQLALIPKLHVLWTIPPALRELVRDAPTPEPEDE